MASPAPSPQQAIPFHPPRPSLVAPASEKTADRVIPPAEVDRQVSSNLAEEDADGEVDDFFANASVEMEKGKDGEFAGLTNPIDKFIRYFTKSGRKRMELYLSRSGKYREMMRGILAKYGLPEDLIYLALIESGFSPKAYSTAKAAGPWQFIAGTGRRYGLRIDWWADERRDAEKSTHAAASYLKDLYGMFDSWPLAAAAYNAGEGKISRAVSRYKSDDFAELIQYRYLAQETKDYVPKMLAALAIAKEPEKYGFSDIAYEEPLNLQTVTVPGGTDLVEMSRILEIPYEEIREWNPELRRFCTPPNRNEYSLRLSVEAATRAQERIAEIRKQAKVTFLQHDVRKKETLEGLAAKYETSPAVLRELNGLQGDSLHRVSRLVIPVTGLSGNEAIPGREVDPDQIMVARMRVEDGRRKSRSAAVSCEKPQRSTVRVRKGQTLAGIAKENDVSLSALAKENGLSAKAKVKAGTRLTIPGGNADAPKAKQKPIRYKVEKKSRRVTG
jgi:membrane-bound lytic murein transglycosylase D